MTFTDMFELNIKYKNILSIFKTIYFLKKLNSVSDKCIVSINSNKYIITSSR